MSTTRPLSHGFAGGLVNISLSVVRPHPDQYVSQFSQDYRLLEAEKCAGIDQPSIPAQLAAPLMVAPEIKK
jgi:hypothetical protein